VVGQTSSRPAKQFTQAVDPLGRDHGYLFQFLPQCLPGLFGPVEPFSQVVKDQIFGIDQMDGSADQGTYNLALLNHRTGPVCEAQGTKIHILAAETFSLVAPIQMGIAAQRDWAVMTAIWL